MNFTAWSMSRLRDYEQCPLMAKHKYLLKTCPLCFKGVLRGKYGEVEVCDACGKSPPEAPPLKRGSEIGATLETFVNGTGKKLHEEIRHPVIIDMAKAYRKAFKKGQIFVETTLCLDKDWKPILDPKREWAKVWLRAKLDVLLLLKPMAQVIDWKTGGIDKRTGAPKESEEYEDQLSIYNTAVLSFHPELGGSEACLAFVDTGPRFDPVVKRDTGTLYRKDLAKAQKTWTKRVKALLTDEGFAPRASYRCGYCPFSRSSGGPCPY